MIATCRGVWGTGPGYWTSTATENRNKEVQLVHNEEVKMES